MTTNNLMYDKKIGLFLGDSILRNYLDANENIHFKLKQTFDIDTIETYYKGGANLGHLATEVFPRLMAEIVNSSDNDVCVDVFISAGAIDISDAISENLDFDINNFLMKRKLLLSGILNHSYVRRVYIFPLTPPCPLHPKW